MAIRTNRRTGLTEGWNDHFQVPEVQQRGIGRLRFDGQPTAIHTVPLGFNGLTLDFYSRLGASDEIYISLHGAQSLERYRYPMFWRIASMRPKAKAFMAFSDPTLLLDPSKQMLLSWYLGGPGWDPLDSIMRAVRKAQGKTGARHICFMGGSGGGYAALRASARLPGSMALVHDPQTSIGNYIPSVVETYFATCWPGWDRGDLLEAFPERFDVVKLYATQQPQNFVYYTQNRADTPHMEKHFTPFLRACGASDGPRQKPTLNRHVFSYTGLNRGHGKITSAEFDAYFSEAVSEWREYRKLLSI